MSINKITNVPLIFLDFLNSKTDSILAVASAMAIGGAFKDLITTIANKILQPMVVKLITLTNIGGITPKIMNLNSIFSPDKGVLGVSDVISSIMSFTFILISVYFAVISINNLRNTITSINGSESKNNVNNISMSGNGNNSMSGNGNNNDSYNKSNNSNNGNNGTINGMNYFDNNNFSDI